MRVAPAMGFRQSDMEGTTLARTSLAALSFACLGVLGAQVLSPRAAVAAGDEPFAAVEVLRGLFASYDYNGDGRITPRELDAFRGLVFVSMDTDADGRISPEEFVAWDPGFNSLAEQRDKEQPFNAAKRDAFEAWDRDGDGSLDEIEMAVSGAHDFVVADENGDGSLSPGEFALGYPILARIAKALR
jgi:Ca2+-binding EF-hand superfamily protein